MERSSYRVKKDLPRSKRYSIIEHRISNATRSISCRSVAGSRPPSPLVPSAYECASASAGYQGEGRGEDGFVPWLFNTHPHLNPPLEGQEETCFRSWRKKTAYCISYAESYIIITNAFYWSPAGKKRSRLFFLLDKCHTM